MLETTIMASKLPEIKINYVPIKGNENLTDAVDDIKLYVQWIQRQL
jgi:hypothetical protein